MSYFHQQNHPNNQPSPHYHQLPPSMIPHNTIRAQQQQRSQPTSPYTNTAATPTTSHQLQQLRYQQQCQQQQQQQHSPHSHYYQNINQHTPYQPQAQSQSPIQPQIHSHSHGQHHTLSLDAIDSLDSLDMNNMHQNINQNNNNNNGHRSPYNNNQTYYNQTQQRSPNTQTHTPPMNNNNTFELPKVQPIIPQMPQPQPQPQPHPRTQVQPHVPPVLPYSGSNESDRNATPQSPTIDAFPDTLPVLDEQNNFCSSNPPETDEHDHENNDNNNNNVSDASDHEETPIPSDEQKLSSTPNSDTLQRLLQQDQDAETASERAFLRELSQIALDETCQTTDKMVSDLTEIEEEMQLESTTSTPSPASNPTQTHTQLPPPSIGRSISHPLQINMKAPLISSLRNRYNLSGSASIGTSPITSPIIPNPLGHSHSHSHGHINHHNHNTRHNTRHNPSPPRIKINMPTANNMISYSSTTTTPTDEPNNPIQSPHTPNRAGIMNVNNSYNNYYNNIRQHHQHRIPLSVTTTPNSYQYRQRNTNYNHMTFPNTGPMPTNLPTNNHINQHRQPHHYPQTPNHTSSHSHNNISHSYHHHLPSLQQNTNTNLYNTPTTNNHSSHSPNNAIYNHISGSQTPGPNMSRLRSKSTSTITPQQQQQQQQSTSPSFNAINNKLISGSMTPATHSLNTANNRRRHSLFDHNYNQAHSNNNKYSRTEKIYNLLQSHGNCMKLSQFTMLYPQQFHEMLPATNRDNNLLKYLVQLPRILVIKCLNDEDIMIFYCETSSHRTVIDILRHNQEIYEKEQSKNNNNNNNEYKGMEIEHFTLRLAEKLNIKSLSDCNIVDFLERWRVVELVDNNKYVRLMPMGSCTVFLGNLNPTKWNENKVRNVLTQINSSWYNLRIRLNQTNYGLLNAFVDFKSMQQAQGAIGLIKNHLNLFESNNNNQQQQQLLYKQQQQQQQYNNNNQQHKQGNNNQNNQNNNISNANNNANNNTNNNQSNQPHGIRVEIEQASAHKNHSTQHTHNNNYHSNNNNNNNNNSRNNNNNKVNTPNKSNSNNNKVHTPNKNDHNNRNNNNNNNFSRITNNIYKLIRDEHNGQILMSLISDEYKSKFNSILEFDGNPKYFVKMERLLLLNCLNSDDVMIFFTPEPAYKLVVTILKQNPCGLSVTQFKSDLERRMNMQLTGCDFNDFLMRWRFLSIRETVNSDTKKKEKMVLFTPHSGSTVFFGNLNVECTENDIYNDLESADKNWKHSSVRLKLGKGFAYAFVDFPTRQDAMKAVQYFDGKQAFKSKYVSADIEAIEQRKRHQNHPKNRNNKSSRNNGRNRSYSNGNSPNNYNSSHHSRRNHHSSHHSHHNGHNNHNGHNKSNKTTVYLGNLRDDVTKSDIQNELRNFNSMWNHLTIRLNLRSGWSHAFVDFELSQDARKLINAWNNRPNPLTSTRLRCEISKRQM